MLTIASIHYRIYGGGGGDAAAALVTPACTGTAGGTIRQFSVFRGLLLPLKLVSLNFMVRTDRRSPEGFLVRCSAQTSPSLVVE